LKTHRKAIVAVVGALVTIAAALGFVVPEDASEAVITITVVLTAVLVERTPNL
jgi:hypothetical protein